MKHLAIPWGIGGILALLAFALWRLIPNAATAFEFEFRAYHWIILIINTAIMAYYEGYKGFQKAFSPRAAARALYLYQYGSIGDLLLAPFFCMAFYSAPRRRVLATWVLTLTIVILILVFQTLPQPIRGILDVGVVIGLFWGFVATVNFCIKAFTDSQFHHSPEIST